MHFSNMCCDSLPWEITSRMLPAIPVFCRVVLLAGAKGKISNISAKSCFIISYKQNTEYSKVENKFSFASICLYFLCPREKYIVLMLSSSFKATENGSLPYG